MTVTVRPSLAIMRFGDRSGGQLGSRIDEAVRDAAVTNLHRLETWCSNQAGGLWDRGCALRIETLDDPGWRVSIDLRGTELIARSYDELRDLCPGEGWMHCRVRNGYFEGCGGPFKLDEILGHFLDWAGTEAPVAAWSGDE